MALNFVDRRWAVRPTVFVLKFSRQETSAHDLVIVG
jgi:hypothetical protein